jgi:hypothetical protein
MSVVLNFRRAVQPGQRPRRWDTPQTFDPRQRSAPPRLRLHCLIRSTGEEAAFEVLKRITVKG